MFKYLYQIPRVITWLYDQRLSDILGFAWNTNWPSCLWFSQRRTHLSKYCIIDYCCTFAKTWLAAYIEDLYECFDRFFVLLMIQLLGISLWKLENAACSRASKQHCIKCVHTYTDCTHAYIQMLLNLGLITIYVLLIAIMFHCYCCLSSIIVPQFHCICLQLLNLFTSSWSISGKRTTKAISQPWPTQKQETGTRRSSERSTICRCCFAGKRRHDLASAVYVTKFEYALQPGASIPPKPMMHIAYPPYFSQIRNFYSYFSSFCFLAPLLRPWWICTSCLTCTGRPWLQQYLQLAVSWVLMAAVDVTILLYPKGLALSLVFLAFVITVLLGRP